MTNFAYDQSNISDIYQYGAGEVHADLESLQGDTRNQLNDNSIVLVDGLPTPLAASRARADRDKMLVERVDPIVSNPLRWAAMTNAKQEAWTLFRTQLLEVPQQNQFPSSISWPSTPA
jgi:hypothetical protein